MAACLIPVLVVAQNSVEGMIMEANPENKHTPLPGAEIYWANTTIGTVTDQNGLFSIPYEANRQKLVIRHIGFKTDTLTLYQPQKVHHWLQPQDQNELGEVVVEKRRQPIQKSLFQAQNIITVSSAELLKAACCNLSESFETNPSIDVNFSDALTGAKQIQMLGLTSPYLLIAQENIPSVRGASQAFGLSFTPGTWVESIQITKGAGSVVNGFESISGQINTELVKPLTDNRFFVNGYANLNGRYELNTHLNRMLAKKWSMGFYLHGNRTLDKMDENQDGFLDFPLAKQLNILNRWQYTDAEKGWVSFLNLRFMNDEKQLGQMAFNPLADKFTLNAWGGEVNTRRLDASVKVGYVFPELPYQSFGFQAAYGYHNQDSYYGFNRYDIRQESIYSTLLFNSIISSTLHKFKTGLSFTLDRYREQANNLPYNRIENSTGAFFEYSYDNLEKVSLQAGLRLDQHNRFGFFVTPRLHLRYTPWANASLRASAGRGIRSAHIFAENQQLFASSRQIDIVDEGGKIYGLNPEIAWNYGISYLQKFNLWKKKSDVTIDFYRTDFLNQVVVDWENPRQVQFYNLEGVSYANSLQVEWNYEPITDFHIRTAYKYYDVKTDYTSGRLQKPLQAKHRLFANLEYQTPRKPNGAHWRFDYTLHWIGEQRLPNTTSNPERYRLQAYSPSYSLMNAQITKVFSNRIEWYAGGENIGNWMQENPIIAAEDPFGPFFDTSIVYAPIMRGMYYTGFRLKW